MALRHKAKWNLDDIEIKSIEPKVKLCEKCNKNPATEPHACPYAEEIHDDHDPEHCTCCDDCTHECAMDI